MEANSFVPEIIGTAIKIFMAWLFLTAGTLKLRFPNYYASSIADYLPVTNTTAFITGIFLGVVETTLAVLIILPAFSMWATLIMVFLLVIYLAALAIQLIQNKTDMDCGCSGPANQQIITPSLLYRNFFLILLAIFCLFTTNKFEMSALAWTVCFFTATFGIFMYLCSEQLLSNHTKLSRLKTS